MTANGEENLMAIEGLDKDTPIPPAIGIGALALNFALKYYDIGTVQDGTLYQQLKLEGRNLPQLHLDMVFETARRMEQHLLATSDRIAAIVIDALEYGAAHDDPEPEPEAPTSPRRSSPPTSGDPADDR